MPRKKDLIKQIHRVRVEKQFALLALKEFETKPINKNELFELNAFYNITILEMRQLAKIFNKTD